MILLLVCLPTFLTVRAEKCTIIITTVIAVALICEVIQIHVLRILGAPLIATLEPEKLYVMLLLSLWCLHFLFSCITHTHTHTHTHAGHYTPRACNTRRACHAPNLEDVNLPQIRLNYALWIIVEVLIR